MDYEDNSLCMFEVNQYDNSKGMIHILNILSLEIGLRVQVCEYEVIAKQVGVRLFIQSRYNR